MVPAVLADRDAPCHHLVSPGRRALSLPLRLLRPNHRQKQQLERPYPPANQQPPRQAVARSPTFANQLHPHVTAAAARTFHAKHTLSFVDLHPLYRMYAAFAIIFPAFRTARVDRVEVAALPSHRDGQAAQLRKADQVHPHQVMDVLFLGGHGAPARSLLRDILRLFFRIGRWRRKRQFQKLVRRENHFH